MYCTPRELAYTGTRLTTSTPTFRTVLSSPRQAAACVISAFAFVEGRVSNVRSSLNDMYS
jgi:hypothetical protein